MKFGLSDKTYIQIKEITKNYKCTFKIFGSRARGDFKQNSDIDIAIDGKLDEKQKYKIRNEFDLLDIPYTVDLIFMDEITKLELIKSIEREGVIFE